MLKLGLGPLPCQKAQKVYSCLFSGDGSCGKSSKGHRFPLGSSCQIRSTVDTADNFSGRIEVVDLVAKNVGDLSLGESTHAKPVRILERNHV